MPMEKWNIDRRFDRHRWRAPLYEGKIEILKTLRKIEDKTIESIRLIGAAYFAGAIPPSIFPLSGGEQRTPEHLVPCEFRFDEPIGINFTDGSSIEILPVDCEHFYIGFNSIPRDIENGTNDRTYDVRILCSKLSRMTIDGVSCYQRRIESVEEGGFEEIANSVKYVCSGSEYGGEHYGFSIEVNRNDFYFAMIESNAVYLYGNCIADISQKLCKKALSGCIKQIFIFEGHDGGSCFWIMPIKIDEDLPGRAVFQKREEEISIEEEDIYDFLLPLLMQYYNKELSLAVRKADKDNCWHEEFEYHLTHNAYTYGDIKAMLAEIRKISFLLETDYDNPVLAPYKKGFSAYKFVDTFDWYTPAEEKEEIIRYNIHIAIDFYRRFIWRMEQMMEASPDYAMISFMGP